jgi:hypothetical protein
MSQKVCTGPCGRTLPATTEHFYHSHGSELRADCKGCYNAGRTMKGKIHDPSDIPAGRKVPVIIQPSKPNIKVVSETITQIEEHRLKRNLRETEAARQDLLKQLDEGNVYNEVLSEARALGPGKPSIEPRERVQSKKREATPLILASDWHIEQEVKPEAVAFRNRYNLDISRRRMQRFFEAIVWAVKQQQATFTIRDIILWLGGDFIQNFLHEDDIENNLLPPLAAIRMWLAEMIAGIDFLLANLDFEQAIIPENDGNHGRTTKKMRSSTRQDHSLETFAYAQLALHYKNEKRLKFILPTSQFTYLPDIYGRTIRFLHGDVFKFGGGVGGITVPLFRALARWEKTVHADLTCMGHWHQRYCLPDVMVNGSLIGYDSYAMGGGFPFESPVQSLRMLDAQRWGSTDIPLWVAERSDDIMSK